MQPYPAQGKLGKVKFNRLAFVRSGNITLGEKPIRQFGKNGYVRSSIAAVYLLPTTASAYWLEFNDTQIYPSAWPDYRYFGFPVRCLVYKLFGKFSYSPTDA